MLSRDAQNLYWMSRYIARANHVCRMLAEQLQAIHDRPAKEIELGWRRIYRSLKRVPAGADLIPNPGSEEFMLADAYTLADDLTFESSNPDAIFACFAKARENARQLRNVLSQDMWSCLNVAYLDMNSTRLLDIWETRPREFFVNASVSFDTFHGIAHSTLYRDPGWHFARMGQFVEQVQQTCNLIDAQYEIFNSDKRGLLSDWESLLAICAARSSYRRLHSFAYHSDDVVNFLVADHMLPTSALHGLRGIEEARSTIGKQFESNAARNAQRHIGRAIALIDFQWPVRSTQSETETRSMLTELVNLCQQFSEDVENAYFKYPVEI